MLARSAKPYSWAITSGLRHDTIDEKKFRGYGPYGYNVEELIARERAVRMRQRHKTA